MAKVETVVDRTGRAPEEWYALLDEWGAPDRPFKEIATWMRDQHGLSKWWAQKLVIEYQIDRGLR